MNYLPIDYARVSGFRKLLAPLRTLVAMGTRVLWRMSPASRSTWYYWTHAYRIVYDLNRAFTCIPRQEKTEIEVQLTARIRMCLDLSRLTDALAWSFGPGEFEFRFLTRRFCQANSVVLDIGANIGTTVLSFAENLPGGRIYAFEPSADILPALRRNIELSDFDNVTVYPFGLANETSAGQLRSAIPGNPGSAYIDSQAKSDSQTVEIRRLDDLFPDPTGIDFIKIDVEGYELKVLQGGTEVIKREKPVIVFEVNETALQRAGTSAQEVVSFLEGLGYRFIQSVNGKFRKYKLTPEITGKLHNAIAVHPGCQRTWATIKQYSGRAEIW